MYIQVKMSAKAMRRSRAMPNLEGTTSCASFVLRKTARVVTRLYDIAFQECGVRSTQFTILVGVAKTQPISISALSELLLIDPTTLTRTLQRLKKDALIQISARSKMRQRFVTLTERGKETLARSLPFWRSAQKRFLDIAGTESWAAMRHELERLARATSKLESGKGKARGSTLREAELLASRLYET